MESSVLMDGRPSMRARPTFSPTRSSISSSNPHQTIKRAKKTGSSSSSSSLAATCGRALFLSCLVAFFVLLSSIDVLVSGIIARGFSTTKPTEGQLEHDDVAHPEWRTYGSSSSMVGSTGESRGERSVLQKQLEEKEGQTEVLREQIGRQPKEQGEEAEGSEHGGETEGQEKRMEWREGRVEVKWRQKASIEDVVEKAVKSAMQQQAVGKDDQWAQQPFQLHIQIRGACDTKGLENLIRSISAADLHGDLLHITAIVSCDAAFQMIQKLEWKHGSIRAVHSGSEENFDPLPLWHPESDSEHLFLLDSSCLISRGFYHSLKTAALSTLLHSTATASSSSSAAAAAAAEDGLDGENAALASRSIVGLALDPSAPSFAHDSFVSSGAKRPRVSSDVANADVAPFLQLSLMSACQLITPRWWTEFWIWHGPAQAVQSSSEQWRFDWDAYDFSSPCRQDWRLSLLTFMSEKRSFNLVLPPSEPNLTLCSLGPAALNSKSAASKPAPSLLSAAHLRQLAALQQFDHCGQRLTDARIATNAAELKEMLRLIARQGAVVGVMVSSGYDDMLNNWLCYVKELQVRNFFIITQDRQQADQLRQRGIFVYCPEANSSSSNGSSSEGHGSKPLDYGSIEYKKFILSRTKAVGETLKAGYNILLADVDAVWLADPFSFIKGEGVDIFAQLEERGNPCGGFLLLIHTRRLIVLWDLITAMFEAHIKWLEGQVAIRQGDVAEAFLKQQQHNHEQKFLKDLLQQGRHKVRLVGLDPLLFINGRDFYDRRKAQKAGVVPVMIHNNYIISKASKTRRFKIKGMWRVDSTGQHCKCIQMTCAKPKDPWFLVNVSSAATASPAGKEAAASKGGRISSAIMTAVKKMSGTAEAVKERLVGQSGTKEGARGGGGQEKVNGTAREGVRGVRRERGRIVDQAANIVRSLAGGRVPTTATANQNSSSTVKGKEHIDGRSRAGGRRANDKAQVASQMVDKLGKDEGARLNNSDDLQAGAKQGKVAVADVNSAIPGKMQRIQGQEANSKTTLTTHVATKQSSANPDSNQPRASKIPRAVRGQDVDGTKSGNHTQVGQVIIRVGNQAGASKKQRVRGQGNRTDLSKEVIGIGKAQNSTTSVQGRNKSAKVL